MSIKLSSQHDADPTVREWLDAVERIMNAPDAPERFVLGGTPEQIAIWRTIFGEGVDYCVIGPLLETFPVDEFTELLYQSNKEMEKLEWRQ